LLSDLEFIRSDETVATVLDTIQLAIPNSPGDTTFKTRPDNYAVVNVDNIQAQTIANYRESGNFVGLRFNIGIIEPDNQAVPTSLADSHPLQTDSLYLGAGLGYVFNQITYAQDTVAGVLNNTIAISGEPLLQTIELDTLVTLRESFDVNVILQVDYAVWFDNVDLASDTPEAIAEEISKNLPNSFSIFDIKQE
ncbi:MAG: MbnP family protein, partial [Saprospiraceae bacterium]